LVTAPVTVCTYSLATAAQFPSGDSAMFLIGSVHLVSILSKVYVSSEYMQTVPSSDPVIKKSFCPLINTKTKLVYRNVPRQQLQYYSLGSHRCL